MPKGLYKATGGAWKAMQIKPGEKCVIHKDRDATHTVMDASFRPKPACDQCAEYGAAHGYQVWPQEETR